MLYQVGLIIFYLVVFPLLLEYIYSPPHSSFGAQFSNFFYIQDYNPKLINFDMFSGGILPERWYGNGCDGYVDDYCKILGMKDYACSFSCLLTD
jgi:hypothetical protein